ncbi:glycosyltransferase family 2 protein [Pedobacter sp. UBA5917]|jgi:glycosyltransferase involved in cell wall biosynthesis|uniref:glycosyltransferase family 2 protein n=1 Tax=Pedobacter sp. UBA5917 TaxID=1947061 RepID=UPI0025CC46E7|nr:glycosyltransferase [Pedobacter sp. UBA5917]
MDNTIKISVIIPCFNQAHFLDDNINSLLKQDYSNWECIIVNDGSTDDTDEKSLAWQQKDNRIKYVSKENGGLSSARNSGLQQATGNYIQFLDADDFLASDKFSKSIAKIADDENLIIITNFVLFDNKTQKPLPPFCKLENKHFTQKALLNDWDKTFNIPIHCAIFPSNLVKKYPFFEDLKAKEDWLFWIQVYENNPPTAFIDEPLAYYRMSSVNMTKNDEFMHQSVLIAYQKLESILNEAQFNALLRYNNTYFLNENFQLNKEIKRLREKRKLKYKVNKVLKFLKLK